MKNKNKVCSKIGFALMQLSFGNIKSTIACLESAIKVLKESK